MWYFFGIGYKILPNHKQYKSTNHGLQAIMLNTTLQKALLSTM